MKAKQNVGDTQMREYCESLGGDYFPRDGKCLVKGEFIEPGNEPPPFQGPYEKQSMPVYHTIAMAVGVLVVGWVIFGRSK